MTTATITDHAPNLAGRTLYQGPMKSRIPATPEAIAAYMVCGPFRVNNSPELFNSFSAACAAADKAAADGRLGHRVEVHAIPSGWGFAECCLYQVADGRPGRLL
jgi:hypothetical protein